MTKHLQKPKKTFDRYKFLDLCVDNFDISQSNKLIKGSHVVNLNLEQVVLAAEDEEFREIIVNSELIIPDGEAIVCAFNWGLVGAQKPCWQRDLPPAKIKLKKLAGIELAKKLLETKKRIAILGSKQEVLRKIKKDYGAKIVFAHHGYFEDQNTKKEELAKKIQASKAEVLLVAMGAPRQEKFINDHKKYFSQMISMGVGGSLDVLAGKAFRAPRWMIRSKLEWLFRIFQEPSRLKRIFSKVPKFFALIFFAKRKNFS